jgi:ligand-binding sensor domain-containing protein
MASSSSVVPTSGQVFLYSAIVLRLLVSISLRLRSHWAPARNPKKELFTTYSPKGNIAVQIEKICLDTKGQIWLATAGKGLMSFNPKTLAFQTYQQPI